MSVEAITWALDQPVKSSTAKFVLVVMANYADSEMLCWPSMPTLIEKTSQDRKTVQENLRRLREWGFILDTGARKGITKQVPVYQLKTPKNGPISEASEAVTEPTNKPENGPVKEAQNRTPSDNETGPNFPHNRPEIPTKQAQISQETGPKTGPGTIIEPPKEPSGNRQTRVKPQQTIDTFTLPDWIPVRSWDGYLAMRKKIRKEPTEYARDLVVDELRKLREAGHDIAAVLDQSTRNNWTDVYPIKGQQSKPVDRQAGKPSMREQQQSTTEAARALLFGDEGGVIDAAA